MISVCKEKHIFIFEDLAEAFSDFKSNGHPDVDATFFSFGTIKPCTSFGGALTVIRKN